GARARRHHRAALRSRRRYRRGRPASVEHPGVGAGGEEPPCLNAAWRRGRRAGPARRRRDRTSGSPPSSGSLSMTYPSRIVCLTEETTETLYLLGQGDRIVGVSGYTVRPPEARQKPKISAFINARFDKIESLRPDLVLAFSDLQADLSAELVRRG